MEIERFTPTPLPPAAPASLPTVAAPAPAPEADADPGPDRDRVALEGLEAELAVLEDELARVDRGRAEGPGRPD